VRVLSIAVAFPRINLSVFYSEGYGESMLKRLAEAHPESVVQLKHQYRMHSQICRLSSDAIYDGKLKTAINDSVLNLPGFPSALTDQVFGNARPWIERVIDPERPVVFANTDGITQTPPTATSPVPKMRDTDANGSRLILPLERTASRQLGGNMVNDTEARLVRLLVQGLVATGLPISDIGIICPFRAQVFDILFCI
jgi:DNA replication ATP-dependent helicase Dna2